MSFLTSFSYAPPARVRLNGWVLAGVLFAHIALFAWLLAASPSPKPLLSPPLVGVLIDAPSADNVGKPSSEKDKNAHNNTEKQKKPIPIVRENVRHGVFSPSPPATQQGTSKNIDRADSASKSDGSDANAASATGKFFSPRIDAAHLNNPKPPYPAASRRLAEEGTVMLSVHIMADGTVADVRLKQSSGYPRLDNAAIGAIRKWRYIPAKQGNTPIPYWHTQAITFSLKD
jgi:protein TonB